MSKQLADKMRQSWTYYLATMKVEPYDWVDVILWKLAEAPGEMTAAMKAEVANFVIELKDAYPYHEEIVWDDYAATNLMGGDSDGFRMNDPEDFMINVIDMADRLRERGAVGVLFADALEACFEDCGEIIAVDLAELEKACEDF